jgi:hypothetical protein
MANSTIPCLQFLCYVCGKQHERSPSYVRSPNKTFCSKQCAGRKHPHKLEILCPCCNKPHKKYKRQFCSRTCAVSFSNQMRKATGVLLDEYSQFRDHLNAARQRAKKKNIVCTLTLNDLLERWNQQNGICPYTGWNLDNPKSTNVKRNIHIKRASVDRKDSSKGYTPDNIEWVAYIVQCMKNGFTKQEVVQTALAIVEKNVNDNLRLSQPD